MTIRYVWSGATGSANGTSWANAYTTIAAAFTAEAAGDIIYVAHDHAETSAGALSWGVSGTISNPSYCICVDRGGSVPPVEADLRDTATVNTTTSATITFNGSAVYQGIIFTAGSGASTSAILAGGSNSVNKFINCTLAVGSTGSNSYISYGNSVSGGVLQEWINTRVSFAAISNTIRAYMGTLKWRDTPNAIQGTIPTTLFTPQGSHGCLIECIGVDFSAAGSGKTIFGALAGSSHAIYKAADCKFDASVTVSAVPAAPGAATVDIIRSGSSGTNYEVFLHRAQGTLEDETTIVLSGGASDGDTPISWKIITTANCDFSNPFECPPLAYWNDDTSSAGITVTVQGIWGGGAVPNNDDVWLEVEYLSDASSPRASIESDGRVPSTITAAAAQAAGSGTWGGSTTKFALSVDIAPAQPGFIYARVRVGAASSTVYIDPKMVVT